MFSDINLVNSETLGGVWKFAHNIHIRNTEKVNFPIICKELNSLVTSVSVKANRRLSLRASSNLISGAAKLYRHSLDKLFGDVLKMDEDLIYRRKRDRLDSSSSDSSTSTVESTVEDPEEMTRSAPVGFMNSSFSPTKRIRTEPALKIAPKITMSRSPSDKLISNDTNSNEEPNHDECTNDSNLYTEHMGTTTESSNEEKPGNYEEEPFSEEKDPENHRKDGGIQTSPILTSRNRKNKDINRAKDGMPKNGSTNGEDRSTNREDRRTNGEDRGTNTSTDLVDQGFDRNLPFGYILIHDSYDSRIPCKIIFTSINSNVNNLI